MSAPAGPLIAWVDAVGAVLLVPGESLTIGGPPRSGPSGSRSATLPLVAPLRTVHAEVLRRGEGWAVRPVDGAVTADGVEVNPGGEAPAASFTLGGAVRCEVAAPNALSPSAVLTVTSGHHPPPSFGAARLERAVVAAGPVVVGPGDDAHVRVREAKGRLLVRCTASGWQWRAAPVPGA